MNGAFLDAQQLLISHFSIFLIFEHDYKYLWFDYHFDLDYLQCRIGGRIHYDIVVICAFFNPLTLLFIE